MIAFIIDEDHIADPEYDRKGKIVTAFDNIGKISPDTDFPVPFRAYDDDDILYYTGRATNEYGALELALDWLQNDSGVTYLRFDGVHGNNIYFP